MTSCSEKMSALEQERYRDAAWALSDPGVQRLFAGRWVVAFERKVIASDTEVKRVLDEANRLVPDQLHHPVFCIDELPENLLSHTSDVSDGLTNG
jgi:hypothetical protein